MQRIGGVVEGGLGNIKGVFQGLVKSSSVGSSQDSSSDSSSLFSDSTIQEEEKANPERKVLAKMEDFYDFNYCSVRMSSNQNIFSERVWSAHFDQIRDQVYLIVARIKRNTVRGPSKKSTFFEEAKPADCASFVDQALDLHQDSTINFELVLQIWSNFDGQKVQRPKFCIMQQVIATKEVVAPTPMGPFEQMDFVQSQFSHYSQMLQIKDKLYIMADSQTLLVFDSYSFSLTQFQLRSQDEGHKEVKAFAFLQHSTEEGQADKLLLFTYYQYETKREDNSFGGYMKNTPFRLDEINQEKMKQKIGVRQIALDDLTKGQSEVKTREQTLSIDDHELIQFYKNYPLGLKKAFFVHRIMGSNTYLMVFPSALLFQISLNPLSVQVKFQLNLKHDQRIIDIGYCLNESLTNHCLWLLDQKMQVWKCTNELSPTSGSWNLRFITQLDNLRFKCFLQEALSYEQFFELSEVFNLQCLHDLDYESSLSHEYVYALNDMRTKGIIVKQPRLLNRETQLDSEEEEYPLDSSLGSADFNLQKKYNVKERELVSMRINIVSLYKRTPNLLTKIQETQAIRENASLEVIAPSQLERRPSLLKKFAGNFKMQLQGDFSDISVTEETNNDEVVQILPAGRVTSRDKGNFQKLFLVQRQHNLEVVRATTDAFDRQPLPHSEVPFMSVITKVSISPSGGRLLIEYRHIKKSKPFLKMFQRDILGNFQLKFTSADFEEALSSGNCVIDNEGRIFDPQIEVVKSSEASVEKIETEQFIQIVVRVPEILVQNRDLIDSRKFEKVIATSNKRLLMTGRLLIQLNEDLNAVEEIGSVMLCNDQSVSKFRFYSLLLKEEAKEIHRYAADNLSLIMNFATNLGGRCFEHQHFYFLYYNDELFEDTSIVRLKADTLQCQEVYHSKSKIVKICLIDESLNHIIWQGSRDNLKETMDFSMKAKPGLGKQTPGLALLSELGSQATIEIVREEKIQSDESSMFKDKEDLTRRKSVWSKVKTKIGGSKVVRAYEEEDSEKQIFSLEAVVTFSFKKDSSVRFNRAIEWISRDKLIVNFGVDFFVLSLRSQDFNHARCGIQFGQQRVTSKIFCSLVKMKDKMQNGRYSIRPSMAITQDELLEGEDDGKEALSLVHSMNCVLRMDMATIVKFVKIRCVKDKTQLMQLLFFTPTEELNGGNIFSKLAANYKVIQPFLEVIDGPFIHLMNKKVTSVNSVWISKFSLEGGVRIEFKEEQEEGLVIMPEQVHMYQADIIGKTVIDGAFQKNAIYSIKAFVESLMGLPDEIQFRNCFDKALLMMIQRGIDVKELVNSQLFYPNFWKKYSLCSASPETVMIGYNNDLDELEAEDPFTLFKNSEMAGEDTIMNIRQDSRKRRKATEESSQDKEKRLQVNEMYEMQYHYILMEEIQGNSKLEVSRVLKDTPDIEIFEQEAIQNIIDYKWDTYAREFYLVKFLAYAIFLAFYYIDLESIHFTEDKGLPREKSWLFYSCKVICSSIQLSFLYYEFLQVLREGSEYFSDPWNYMENFGSILFFWGAIIDLNSTYESDQFRIVSSMSVIFTLIKIVYLIRVFRQLNFLVTMFITVVNQMTYFLILFGIFLLTLAESFSLVDVDVSAYGRIPRIGAYSMAVLRCAMGDFSILDPYQGFDLYTTRTNEDGEEVQDWRYSLVVIYFTFFFYLITIFFMFMIFMNFIIAVIGESYSTVTMSKEAFDYKLRASMIFEREIHFAEDDFHNPSYFPRIILVRKRKHSEKTNKSSLDEIFKQIKFFFRHQIQRTIEATTSKSQEVRVHLSSSLKILENDTHSLLKHLTALDGTIQRFLPRLIMNNATPISPSIRREAQVQHFSFQSVSGQDPNSELVSSPNGRSLPPIQQERHIPLQRNEDSSLETISQNSHYREESLGMQVNNRNQGCPCSADLRAIRSQVHHLHQNQKTLIEKVDKLVEAQRNEKAKTKRIGDSLSELRDEARSSNEGFRELLGEIKSMLAERPPPPDDPQKRMPRLKLSPAKRIVQRMRSKDEAIMKQVQGLKRYQDQLQGYAFSNRSLNTPLSSNNEDASQVRVFQMEDCANLARTTMNQRSPPRAVVGGQTQRLPQTRMGVIGRERVELSAGHRRPQTRHKSVRGRKKTKIDEGGIQGLFFPSK